MPHDPCSVPPEVDSTAAFASPFPLFLYDAVLFAAAVVCIPTRTGHLWPAYKYKSLCLYVVFVNEKHVDDHTEIDRARLNMANYT